MTASLRLKLKISTVLYVPSLYPACGKMVFPQHWRRSSNGVYNIFRENIENIDNIEYDHIFLNIFHENIESFQCNCWGDLFLDQIKTNLWSLVKYFS